MKERRETHSLRFSRVGWIELTSATEEVFGSADKRAQYIEGMARFRSETRLIRYLKRLSEAEAKASETQKQ